MEAGDGVAEEARPEKEQEEQGWDRGGGDEAGGRIGELQGVRGLGSEMEVK